MWNTTTGRCLHSATLGAAIISLSFHPLGDFLAIASGQFVYLWDYNVRDCEKGSHCRTMTGGTGRDWIRGGGIEARFYTWHKFSRIDVEFALPPKAARSCYPVYAGLGCVSKPNWAGLGGAGSRDSLLTTWRSSL